MSSVDDETILEVLRTGDEPRMTTTEVADQLPITRGTTRTRLQALVDEGLVTREREGRNVVWWLPERADEIEEVPASTDEDDTDGEASTDEGDVDDVESTDEDDTDGEASTDEGDAAAASTGEAASAGDDEEADAEADDTAPEVGTEEAPATEEDEADDEADDAQTTVEPTEESPSSGEAEPQAEPGDDDGIEVRTPDRTTGSRMETLPETPQDDRTVQAVLALVALAILYALVRRLRG